MPPDVPVVILAGGEGRRMGGNKPFHPVEGTTMIEAVISRLEPQTCALVLNAGQAGHPLASRLVALGLPVIYDDEPLAGLGPLSGVLSALTFARNIGASHVVTTPCDMPHIPPDLVDRLVTASPACVAFVRAGRDHPLCARWDVALEGRLRRALTEAAPAGGLAVMAFLTTVATSAVDFGDAAAFANINAA